MKIVLEPVEEEHRGAAYGPCWLCRRGFTVGAAVAWAYSDDGVASCGPTCPMCLEEGADRMQERLEAQAAHDRRVAEESELLAREGVTQAPSLEELRAAERRVAAN